MAFEIASTQSSDSMGSSICQNDDGWFNSHKPLMDASSLQQFLPIINTNCILIPILYFLLR
jgi:hypothetical protein